MKSLALIFWFHLSISLAFAQVPNNQINQRFSLLVDDAPISSTTELSTVEWQCISKALTNKCLVYHNDQWFTFTVDKAGSYYINLSGQKCKKRLGTQLILIEGNPCEIKTYKILQCVPRLPSENSYVRADSLKANVTYLLNVDGFLADECDFNIQVSTKPRGFPVKVTMEDSVASKIEIKKRFVTLFWYIENERVSTLKGFHVQRSSNYDGQSRLINEQSIRRNTFGVYELIYSFTDTLPQPGLYTYKVFGRKSDSDELVLVSTDHATYQEERAVIKPERQIDLNLEFQIGLPFRVVLIDAKSSQELYKYQSLFAKENQKFTIQLGEWVDQGKKEFIVITSDFSAQNSRDWYYKMNNKGKWIRQ